MTDRGFARELHDATHAWVAEGLVTGEQAERLRARHPLPAPGDERPGAVSSLLYAAAGILLGAAGIALIAVTFDLDAEAAQLPLALVAAVLLAAGMAARLALDKPLLGDALLVASLVPAVASGIGDLDVLAFAALALAAGLLVWRREGGFVATLAVIAFSVAAAMAAQHLSEGLPQAQQQDAFLWTWASLQAALLAAVVSTERARLASYGAAAAPLATIGLGVSLVLLLSETFDLDSEAVEIALGAMMLGLAGIGAGLRHRGLVLGASIVLCLDAIVFGFDVGGVLTGTLTLVAVAALLIWQAELVKKYLAA